MPAEFTPVAIPLTSGVREDLSDLATEEPSALRVAENVVFTRQGAVRGRPAQQPRAGTALTYDSSGPVTGTFAAARAGLVPAGIVRVPGTPETALALYQSKAFHRGVNGVWTDVGPFWSVRKTQSADMAQPLSLTPYSLSTGTSVVCTGMDSGGTVGLPVLESTGVVAGVIGDPEAASGVVVGDRVFYVKSSALWMQTPGTFPSVIKTVVAISCGTVITACPGAGTDAIVFAQDQLSSTSATLFRINAAGTITGTLAVSFTSTANMQLAVACDPSTGFVYPVYPSGSFAGGTGGGILHTCVVDASFNAVASSSHVVEQTATVTAVTAGYIDKLYVGVSKATGDMSIKTRVAGAAGTNLATLWALAGLTVTNYASTPGYHWQPLFQPGALGGKPVMGILKLLGKRYNTDPYDVVSPGTFRAATWYVIDLSRLVAGGTAPPPVVAAGVTGGVYPSSVTTATYSGSSVKFTVLDGRSYNADNIIDRYAATRIDLGLVGARARDTDGVVLMSSATPYRFDGSVTGEVGFLETPVIRATPLRVSGYVYAPPGLSGGSYSYQAIWTAVDGSGRVVRSPASDIVTVSTAAVGGSGPLGVALSVGQPQLGTLKNVTTEIYATVVNPTAGADKYLLNFGYSLSTHASEVDTSQRALYTGGGVIDDERPQAGDRGVAVVGDRVWVASQGSVYSSRLPDQRFSSAWNSEGFLALQLPAALGNVEALACAEGSLVVLCSGGVLVVSGEGFDNRANGTGWQPQVVSTIGCAPGPRNAAETTRGVCFIGVDGEVYLVAAGGVQCISRPVRREGQLATDLTYVPAGLSIGAEQTTNPLLVVGGYPLRVLDLETGQWATWKTGGAFT